MTKWDVPGYTALRPLGSGGSGNVVAARHDASGAPVAIKYLSGELVTDREFTKRFRGEAAALSSVEEVNVVRLYEYVESSSGAAIVMELVHGISLRQILASQDRTTPEAALAVLQGSLLGLAAAHRRGVVHRDCRPENVLVDGDGVSKLTDFGIAARTGDQGYPLATLCYAAPEQIAGSPASPAGDVYAATVTFYECLTGSRPFIGDSIQLLRQHRVAPVPLELVPEPLRPLVSAGMAKNLRQRPADALDLVAALRQVASGAYGPDWAERGRSHLSEAAVALAALWPAGAPPAARHRASVRRQRAAIVAAATIVGAAAGTFLAASGSRPPGSHDSPVAVVRTVVPQPPSAAAPPAASSAAHGRSARSRKSAAKPKSKKPRSENVIASLLPARSPAAARAPHFPVRQSRSPAPVLPPAPPPPPPSSPALSPAPPSPVLSPSLSSPPPWWWWWYTHHGHRFPAPHAGEGDVVVRQPALHR